MNLIDKQLEKIKQEKRLGLMTHVVIGYPSLQDTVKIVKVMADNGADLIELQIPFSDPLADGSTIMKACEKSLRVGTKVKDAFKIMGLLSSQLSIPLLFMAYYNTVFKYGVGRFCQDAKESGASGLIVPDMPIDEENEEHFISNCRKYTLHNIQVISPVSTEQRLKKNAKVASGFVYCTTHQGITGVKNKPLDYFATQNQLDPAISAYLKKVRKIFLVPIAVGFGISKKEHLKQLAPYADIAVIGSAIIEIIDKSDEQVLSSGKKENMLANVKNFLKLV